MTRLKADHFRERPLHNLAIPAIGGIQELLLGDRSIAIKPFCPHPSRRPLHYSFRGTNSGRPDMLPNRVRPLGDSRSGAGMTVIQRSPSRERELCKGLWEEWRIIRSTVSPRPKRLLPCPTGRSQSAPVHRGFVPGHEAPYLTNRAGYIVAIGPQILIERNPV